MKYEYENICCIEILSCRTPAVATNNVGDGYHQSCSSWNKKMLFLRTFLCPLIQMCGDKNLVSSSHPGYNCKARSWCKNYKMLPFLGFAVTRICGSIAIKRKTDLHSPR